MLQWGRNFAVAETPHRSHVPTSAIRWLQWGRNFAVAETCRRICTCRKRRTLLQWGRNFAVAETDRLQRARIVPRRASMGPQLCSCGNQQKAAERTAALLASMGPQLCSCGNQQKAAERTAALLASMGPQLCSCGNTASGYTRPTLEPLQWGRNFAVAETPCRQSGRRHKDTASMGPQLCSCGNSMPAVPTRSPIHRFNGAATLQLRKPESVRSGSRRYNRLQWGRNFAVAETSPVIMRSDSTPTCFNGAATLQLRKPVGLNLMRNLNRASMGPQLCSCGNRHEGLHYS